MKRTILVPVDFSDVAMHTAKYAVKIAKQLQIDKILLYHAWQLPVTANPEVPSITQETSIALEEGSHYALAEFKKRLEASFTEENTVEVDSVIEYSNISSGVGAICKEHDVTLVVMGVTGSGKFDETFVGSHAVNTAKRIDTPVLIVPASYEYSPIQDILFSCDYKDIESTLPVEKLKRVLHLTQAKLFVAYVDTTGALTDNAKAENEISEKNQVLKSLLDSDNIDFHVIHKADYVEAINTFAVNNNIDLIIAIPKKKSFWDSIFKPSRTKQLAFNGNRPLLVVHQGL